MANVIFDSYKAVVLGVDAVSTLTVPNWVGTNVSTFRASLIDTADYSPDPTADVSYNDLKTAGGGADACIVAAGDLAGPTASVSAGVATIDADPLTLSAVTGDSAERIIVDCHAGTDATSVLIVFFDTATGLAVTPNGGDITITWNASGIWTW